LKEKTRKDSKRNRKKNSKFCTERNQSRIKQINKKKRNNFPAYKIHSGEKLSHMRAISAARKSGTKRGGVRTRTPIKSVAGLMLGDSANANLSNATEKALSPKARQAARASARRNAKNKGKKKAKRVIGHRLKTQAPPGGVSTISIAHGAESAKSPALATEALRATSYADDDRSMYADSSSPAALNPIARRKQLGGAQMASIFGSMGGKQIPGAYTLHAASADLYM